jgi:hypothetical protein
MGLLLKFRPGPGASAESGPDGNRRPAEMGRAQWRTELRERRVTWRTPRIDTLQRPAMSMARRIGLLTLRAYIHLRDRHHGDQADRSGDRNADLDLAAACCRSRRG